MPRSVRQAARRPVLVQMLSSFEADPRLKVHDQDALAVFEMAKASDSLVCHEM